MAELEIKRTSFDSPVAARLIREALADLGQRYGGPGDATPIAAGDFDPPNGDFFVAWLDGRAVGCGGWRGYDAGTAEIKRMYTAPEARGRGVARALLAAVEESARANGRQRAILETGDRQPEAIGLYRAAGYTRIPDFGHYKDAPGVLSFGRDIAPA